MNQNRLNYARQFFAGAHAAISQVRKYSGQPYSVHTEAVAELVKQHGGDEDTIIAAFGHDVLEDVTPILPDVYNYSVIQQLFGKRVADLILHLTDVYTKEAYPEWNRAIRKAKEAERISLIPDEAKLVKLADIYDNGKDIITNDPNFAITYLREKDAVLAGLAGVNDELWVKCKELITG